MDITPLIPDGYNGSIKRLTCRICKHIFYLTMVDYGQLGEVSYCYECSLILREDKNILILQENKLLTERLWRNHANPLGIITS